jgi:hypothetical protein
MSRPQRTSPPTGPPLRYSGRHRRRNQWTRMTAVNDVLVFVFWLAHSPLAHSPLAQRPPSDVGPGDRAGLRWKAATGIATPLSLALFAVARRRKLGLARSVTATS